MAAADPLFVCNESDRDAWLEHRTTGIGSSDAPCILALDKAWGNPFTISCLKRGIVPPEGDVESELMDWGHYVEPSMIKKFCDETGFVGKVSGDMFRRGAPTDNLGFMMATLDGIVAEDSGKTGGIECKLSIFTADEWEREGVPEHVVCQDQHAMAVMGWDFVYTLALLDGYRLRWKKVERSAEVIGDLLEPAETEFWQRLQDGDQFDAGVGRPDQSPAFLKHLHPNDNGKTVHLEGDHLTRAMDSWRISAAERKAAKKREDQAKNTLVQAVGDASFGILDDGRRFSNKSQTRGAHSVKESTFKVLRETK